MHRVGGEHVEDKLTQERRLKVHRHCQLCKHSSREGYGVSLTGRETLRLKNRLNDYQKRTENMLGTGVLGM